MADGLIPNVANGVVANPDNLSTRRRIYNYISLGSDGAIRLCIENHYAVDALLGAAGDTLGEIRCARLRAIELDRKLCVELRRQKSGSCYSQVSRPGSEPICVRLPIMSRVPFGQLDFVGRRIVSVNGEIALVDFCGIETGTRGQER